MTTMALQAFGPLRSASKKTLDFPVSGQTTVFRRRRQRRRMLILKRGEQQFLKEAGTG
jgi:hypothetical protein